MLYMFVGYKWPALLPLRSSFRAQCDWLIAVVIYRTWKAGGQHRQGVLQPSTRRPCWLCNRYSPKSPVPYRVFNRTCSWNQTRPVSTVLWYFIVKHNCQLQLSTKTAATSSFKKRNSLMPFAVFCYSNVYLL